MEFLENESKTQEGEVGIWIKKGEKYEKQIKSLENEGKTRQKEVGVLKVYLAKYPN
jgi:hypothetical protein